VLQASTASSKALNGDPMTLTAPILDELRVRRDARYP
jgi:hypothetical protein